MQPLVSQLLHVAVGQTEQPVSAVPAGVGRSTNWQIAVVFVWPFGLMYHSLLDS